jgi:4-hydroxybutyryl-CoA dehydratase/vinylacetyl-CoA-Delta-isomerase
LPSEADYRHEELGPLLEKYLKGRDDVPTEHRVRILRLIENMTLGRNSVGYLTESLHGAGSPQAQRIQIYRQMQIDFKQGLAKRLAGIDLPDSVIDDMAEIADGYFARVFAIK